MTEADQLRYVEILRDNLSTTSLVADTRVFEIISKIASLPDNLLKQFARFYDQQSYAAIQELIREQLERADA